MNSNGYEEPLGKFSAIWGDQYALTMAQALFTNGKHNINTTFHAFIRNNPFNGGYLITAGQNIINEWLSKNWRFDDRDIVLMRRKTVLNPATGQMEPLFTPDFIDMAAHAKPALTIHAMPEGEIAFPDEPIWRVHGPAWQCLMVESPILNTTNSQSLFATLASRLVEVAEGAPIVEFGLRRAQAIGGLESSRGAWIGGVSGTSNMLAEKYYGIPSTGTFAHALVMLYEDELEAFKDYAKAMPYNGVFLVDTYDTLEGVRRAVKACQDLGVKLKGIRLDSGDLTYLSKEARKILDAAGFKEALIVASNDLDEKAIASMKHEGCKIDMWGVGTNLVTAKAQPALGGVYKLGAVYDGKLSQAEIDAMRTLIQKGSLPHLDPHFMRNVIKLSEQAEKTTIPGELDVLRYVFHDATGKPVRYNGDTLVSTFTRDPVQAGVNPGRAYPDALAHDVRSVRKYDETLAKTFPAGTPVYRPLKTVFHEGQLVGNIETVHEARARAKEGLAMLDPAHRRLMNPHVYVVGLEESLFRTRQDMIKKLRQAP